MPLGEVVCNERDPVGSPDGNGLPVFGVTNIHGVTQTGIETSADLSKYLRLRPGRFVYNPYRVNVGSLGLSSRTQDGIVSPAYVVFAPTERVDATYLHYFLKSAKGHQLINFHGNRGSVRSALRFDDLSCVEIPLPPLPEQRRIVARIEELADSVTEANGINTQASAAASALMSAVIESSLSLAAKDPRTHVVSLNDACALVTDGAHHTPASLDAGVPLLMATNVWDDHLDTTNVRFISQADHEVIYKRAPVEKGDVLFINIGATTGTTTKVDTGLEFSIKNVALLKPDRERLDADYLVFFLRSPTVKNMIAERQAQTCQQFLSLRELRNLRFPVPTLQEQRRIVTELDVLQTKVDELKRLQAETQAELDALMPSILDRAFKGEL